MLVLLVRSGWEVMLPEHAVNVSGLLLGCTLGRRPVCRSFRNKLARVGFFLFAAAAAAASIRGVRITFLLTHSNFLLPVAPALCPRKPASANFIRCNTVKNLRLWEVEDLNTR